jgi:hypothetical protein
MKVAIGSRIVEGPWGGGNRFVIALRDSLLSEGHNVVFDLNDNDIDIILLTDPRSRIPNISISAGMIFRYLLFVNRNCIVIHRVNECDERKKTRTMNTRLKLANSVADHTVFVGSWLKKIAIWKNKSEQNSTVILNGADRTIFNNEDSRLWTESEPLKLVTHHWGGNWMKGFDIYSAIDDMLQDNEWSKKIEFTYIGNLPKGFKFKKARYINALNGAELADELKRHHVYITATINEPGSNHQNEGALCGLPLLYRNSGCLQEYCDGYGVMFNDVNDFMPKLQEMMNDYVRWQSEITHFNLTSEKMVLAYMELFNSLISRRDSIIKKRQIWRNIPVMLFNQIPL